MDLRKIRKSVGLTQKELAEKANISLTSYQAYERGTVVPPRKKLDTILNVLDIHPDEYNNIAEKFYNVHYTTNANGAHGNYLLREDSRNDYNQDQEQSQELRTIISAFHRLNFSGRRALVERSIELTEISKFTIPETLDDVTLPAPIKIDRFE